MNGGEFSRYSDVLSGAGFFLVEGYIMRNKLFIGIVYWSEIDISTEAWWVKLSFVETKL